ncbi:MAG: FKBP-type peptidyl-prolyl cis-trans isomerase [Simkania negevensis]|nr:FKBP-type peptidyl-prolyl cis-trans isomerase [Simkania negevensis]
MSNRKFFGILIHLAIFSSFCSLSAEGIAPEKEMAVKNKEEPKKEEINVQKISEAFGHLIGKNLENFGFEFDVNQVMKGIQDSLAGKQSPMDETSFIHAISLVQEKAHQKLAEDNLKEANAFLLENAQKKGVIEIEKQKLQYKIEQEGKGAVVQEHFTPMIRYTGKFLDGKLFGSSQEEEMMSLDETFLRKGIIGMLEGEKRTLYVHPDRGYGTNSYLPPNSLLIFDIEVIKANVTPQEEASLTTTSDQKAAHHEIALPEEKKSSESFSEPKAVR